MADPAFACGLSLIDTFKGSLPLKLKIPPGGKLVYTLLLKKIAEV